jgi:hypothetical protein
LCFCPPWWRLVYFQCSELSGMIWQVFCDGFHYGICSTDAGSRWTPAGRPDGWELPYPSFARGCTRLGARFVFSSRAFSNFRDLRGEIAEVFPRLTEHPSACSYTCSRPCAACSKIAEPIHPQQEAVLTQTLSPPRTLPRFYLVPPLHGLL